MSQLLGAGYVLDEPIGQGATGEVWRGSRRSDGYPFAFKLLRPHLLSNRLFVSNFIQERDVLTGLEPHPNLVHIHDLVVEGQQFAIVMDLIGGRDLREELFERGTLPVAEALVLVAGVLSGAAALHAAGVMHRDLKPENILLDRTTNGVIPRVTDYGTAKLLADAAAARTSTVIGTPDYMAPELADQGEVSGRADVYSVGIVLYELLCGVTPFAGGPPIAILRRHLDQRPGRPDHVDDRVWDLVSRMLTKQPGRRPPAQQAAAESRDLAEKLVDVPALPKLAVPPPPPAEEAKATVLVTPPGAAPPPAAAAAKSRLPLLIVAAATAAVVLVGAGIAIGSRGDDEAAVSPAPASSRIVSSPTPEPVPTGSASPSETASTPPSPASSTTSTPTDPGPTRLPVSAAVNNECGTSAGDTYAWEESDATTNGTTLDDAVECQLDEYDAYSNEVDGEKGPYAQLDFVMPREFKTFRGMIGFSDETPDSGMKGKVSVVSAAGDELFREKTLTAGKPLKVSARVGETRRISLRVRITNPDEGGIRELVVVAGDFSISKA